MHISNSELAPLWDKYKRLALKVARRFTTPHYELEDLMQECFIIFVATVKDYDPDSGHALSTHLYNRFRWGLIRLIYNQEGERRIKEVMALDTPFDSEDPGSGTMADQIPDPAAEFEDTIIDRAALSPVWNIARRELAAYEAENGSRCPGRLYGIIKSQYPNGLALQEIANAQGVDIQLLKHERRLAVERLRRSVRLWALYEGFIGQSVHHSGLDSFKHSGESSVEWAVLKREQLLDKINSANVET